MFLYLTFLRTPPAHVCISQHQKSGISLTPQISNDLRTEFPNLICDIYYIWLPIDFTSSTSPPHSFKKLTTYHGTASMYKELKVPLPSNVRNDQNWTLALSSSPNYTELHIPLSDLANHSRPFPVLSMPIKFSAKSSGEKTKQEEIRRLYSFPLPPIPGLSDQPLSLSLVERTAFDLDKKIWDSGIGLSSWLTNHFGVVHSDNRGTTTHLDHVFLDKLNGKQPLKIIELGAGIGIVSIVLGVLRSHLHHNHYHHHLLPEDTACHDIIITTDLPSAMPLLKDNINRNMSHFHHHHDDDDDQAAPSIPKAMILDWSKPLPAEIHETQFDVVVMADVTYNTSSFPALINTLSSLRTTCTAQNQDTQTHFLLGYKERDPDERILWDMAKKEVGIDFVKMGEVLGAGEQAVEIWIGSCV